MRFFRALFAAFCIFAGIKAQSQHFIYIQTENKQAFYIRLNEKLYSSSGSGYLIIPKLSNGNYTLNIGFPKNEWPAQAISIQVSDKDLGFLLKNFEEKGWGLFNLQSMAVHTSTSTLPLLVNKEAVEKKDDAFSNTLSQVANITIDKSAKPGNDVEEKDSSTMQRAVAANENIKEEKGSTIHKILSVLDESGRSLVYAYDEIGKTDTVRIWIPYNITQAQISENKFKGQLDTVPIGKEVPVSTTGAMVFTNTSCNKMADENDFLQLRKKMAAAESETSMLTIAKKAFRAKCYSTVQLKNLSVLFLDEPGKVNFFEAAYPSTGDQHNFKSLQSLLSDENNIRRFQAIIP